MVVPAGATWGELRIQSGAFDTPKCKSTSSPSYLPSYKQSPLSPCTSNISPSTSNLTVAPVSHPFAANRLQASSRFLCLLRVSTRLRSLNWEPLVPEESCAESVLWCRTFMIRASQLLHHTRYSDTECRQVASLTPQSEWTATFPAKP